jgi:hypothetical protein
VDVGRISKALNKFQFKQKPLPPIIRILVYILWPNEKEKNNHQPLSTAQQVQPNPKIALFLMKKLIDADKIRVCCTPLKREQTLH